MQSRQLPLANSETGNHLIATPDTAYDTIDIPPATKDASKSPRRSSLYADSKLPSRSQSGHGIPFRSWTCSAHGIPINASLAAENSGRNAFGSLDATPNSRLSHCIMSPPVLLHQIICVIFNNRRNIIVVNIAVQVDQEPDETAATVVGTEECSDWQAGTTGQPDQTFGPFGP